MRIEKLRIYNNEEIENMKIEELRIKLKELQEVAVEGNEVLQKAIEKMSMDIAKIDNSNKYCCGRKKICPYDNPTLKKCKECIKIYYEKRCKNGNCKSRQNNDFKL